MFHGKRRVQLYSQMRSGISITNQWIDSLCSVHRPPIWRSAARGCASVRSLVHAQHELAHLVGLVSAEVTCFGIASANQSAGSRSAWRSRSGSPSV